VRRLSLLLSCPLPDEVQLAFAARHDVVTQHLHGTPDSVVLRRLLDDREVLVTSVGLQLSAEVIAAFPARTRVIATYSVGHEHIDLSAARERDIAVLNTPDVLTDSVADAALLLLLGAARRATESIALVRSGSWTGWTARQLNGIELAGRNAGILGMGRIGRAVAARCRAFGMQIHYSNRHRLPAELELDAVFHPSPESMLAETDALLMTCPLTPETYRFLNTDRIACLREGALVINVARGDLVDDSALIEALGNGRVRGAGLDVFANEPALDVRYLELPNAFLLPHIGSSTVDARMRMAQVLITGLEAWCEGRRAPNQIA
jgi:lactate dehydrogenase-like 2-hydroxyacid dehydrogenase